MNERRLRTIRGKRTKRTPKSFWVASLVLLILYALVRAHLGVPTPLHEATTTPREAVAAVLNASEPDEETRAHQALRVLPQLERFRERFNGATIRLQPSPPTRPTAP